MKKKLLFIAILILISIFSLSACSEPAECAHEFSEWETVVEATCISDGSKKHTCQKCGFIELEKIDAASHSYGEWIPGTDATCDTNGVLGHYECQTCGKYFDESKNLLQSLIVLGSHQLGEWKLYGNAANGYCEDNIFYATCSQCDEVKFKSGEYSDHNFTVITTPPTCTAQGYDEKMRRR